MCLVEKMLRQESTGLWYGYSSWLLLSRSTMKKRPCGAERLKKKCSLVMKNSLNKLKVTAKDVLEKRL